MHFFIPPRENDNQVFSENNNFKKKTVQEKHPSDKQKCRRVLNRGLECQNVDSVSFPVSGRVQDPGAKEKENSLAILM